MKRAVIFRDLIVKAHRSTWQVGAERSSCCSRSSTATKWKSRCSRSQPLLSVRCNGLRISIRGRSSAQTLEPELIFRRARRDCFVFDSRCWAEIYGRLTKRSSCFASPNRIGRVRASNTAEGLHGGSAYRAICKRSRPCARPRRPASASSKRTIKEVARALAEASRRSQVQQRAVLWANCSIRPFPPPDCSIHRADFSPPSGICACISGATATLAEARDATGLSS